MRPRTESKIGNETTRIFKGRFLSVKIMPFINFYSSCSFCEISSPSQASITDVFNDFLRQRASLSESTKSSARCDSQNHTRLLTILVFPRRFSPKPTFAEPINNSGDWLAGLPAGQRRHHPKPSPRNAQFTSRGHSFFWSAAPFFEDASAGCKKRWN